MQQYKALGGISELEKDIEVRSATSQRLDVRLGTPGTFESTCGIAGVILIEASNTEEAISYSTFFRSFSSFGDVLEDYSTIFENVASSFSRAADVIMHPERIARQKLLLDENQDVGVVGTWKRCFDENTEKTIFFIELPTDDAAIRRKMFFNIGISRATAMFRMEALRALGTYSETYQAAEDYDLIRRVGSRYKLANIPEHLMHYQISMNGQSQRRRRKQLVERCVIQAQYFQAFRWRAWAGIMQTALLFCVPTTILASLKSRRHLREVLASQ